MASCRSTAAPLLSLGLASITLGGIALALFMLPILAMPIALGGIAMAVVEIVRSRFGKQSEARLAIVGLCFSGLAFAVGFAINYAPIASHSGVGSPRMWHAADKGRYVPPPLRLLKAAGSDRERVP